MHVVSKHQASHVIISDLATRRKLFENGSKVFLEVVLHHVLEELKQPVAVLGINQSVIIHSVYLSIGTEGGGGGGEGWGWGSLTAASHAGKIPYSS